MWIKFAMALIPIIWLIISLGVMRMPAARACIIGLVLTILLAIFSFKLSVPNTLTAALEGIIMEMCIRDRPLVNHPVVDGINKPGELIDDIMDGKADTYHASAADKSEESSSTEKPGLWASIYKNLMSGISHMLPFVIGGGILMAISFIVENYGGGAKTPRCV